jgi:hypothetical protein
MDEYLSLTLLAAAGESEAAFKSRLTAFWSAFVREFPDDFEKVYAEKVKYGRDGGVLTRQYLIETVVADTLTAALKAAGLAYEPLDRDDVYSKYEAAPPEWFWLEH